MTRWSETSNRCFICYYHREEMRYANLGKQLW